MNLPANWNLTRILNTVLGLFLVGSYVFHQNDFIALLFGGILLAQAYFNVGCLLGACMPSSRQQNKTVDANQINEEITYEEVK